MAEQLNIPLLPTLAYGCSLGHSRRWPGTLALQPITMIELVKQIGDWAYHSGVRRLFIVNAHVGNASPLRCALEMLRAEHDDMMVALFNSGTLSARVRKAHFADADDWHANDAETSLMLAIAPNIRARREDRRRRRSRPHGRLRVRASGQPHERQRRHRQSEPRNRREALEVIVDRARRGDVNASRVERANKAMHDHWQRFLRTEEETVLILE